MPSSSTSRRTVSARDIERLKLLLRTGEGARALRMIGDRWSFLILRDAFLGVRRFEDLRRLTGATRGTLTARLSALIENGFLYRHPSAEGPKRFEYRLTEKALGFYPVALVLWIWEGHWSDPADLPPSLIHARCGKKLVPVQVCGHCRKPIDRHEVTYEPGPGERYFSLQRGALQRGASRTGDIAPQATRRRDPGSRRSAAGVDRTMFHAVDTIGDRWSGLLLATLFFGLHRYDDINAALGIATNILADRLRHLLAAGVVEQHLYRERPLRYEYRLTQKGWDLFPFTLALHEWGSRWIPAPRGPALRLRHKRCGHTLSSKMTCASCGVELEPREVRIRSNPRWNASRVAPAKRGSGGK
jgi:DNA-binding HxlR family transcriptional regulator